MRSLIFLTVALGVVGLPLVILAFSLAGFFGGLIAVLVILAIGLRFAGFLGLFVIPKPALTLANYIIVIGTASVLFIGGTKYYHKTQEEEARRRPALVREAVKNKIEIILYPDRYTWVPFPEHHWGHFVVDQDFRVKLTQKNAEGQDEFDFLAGKKWPFLGDEIPDKKLGLMSLTGKPLRMAIFLRPKR